MNETSIQERSAVVTEERGLAVPEERSGDALQAQFRQEFQALPREERDATIWRMVTMGGLSQREISRRVGLSLRGVQKAIDRVAEQSWGDDQSNKRKVSERRIDLTRLGKIAATMTRKAVEEGDIAAAGAATRAMERRAKLMGLDDDGEQHFSGIISVELVTGSGKSILEPREPKVIDVGSKGAPPS